MGKLGEHVERKLRTLMGAARAASAARAAHREGDDGDIKDKETVELLAWEEVYRHVTDDDLGKGRHKDIIPDQPQPQPQPDGGQ